MLRGKSPGNLNCRAVINLIIVLWVGGFVFRMYNRMRGKPMGYLGGRSSLDTAIDKDRTLSFQACNSFAEQRISLLIGAVMAKELRRTVMMPRFLLDQQMSAPAVTSLSNIYKVEKIEQALERHGIPIVHYGANPPADLTTCQQFGAHCLETIGERTKDWAHVSFGCPFAEQVVPHETILQHKSMIVDLLRSLEPSDIIKKHLMGGIAHIQRVAKEPAFHYLRFHAPESVKYSGKIGELMASKGFERGATVYVTTEWEKLPKSESDTIQRSLTQYGYKMLRDDSVFAGVHKQFKREVSALVNYYVGLHARKTIGHSASMVSALMIMDRRQRKQFATQYDDTGDIPLSRTLPLFQLPWVFPYTVAMEPDEYTYLTKAAILSAQYAGGLLPYCLYFGPETSEMREWMEANNVTVIPVKPKWRFWLSELNSNRKANLRWSHNYAHPLSLIGTFLRVDIPLLDELKQYEFVFYTDTDIYFRRHISLDSFPQPLPATIGMGFEMAQAFPYNAGVALWNMNGMRAQYDGMMAFLKTQKGLHFGMYGPLDQGLLNQYYERDIKQYELPQIFNAKPYHLFDPNAALVHWHGAKPHDYVHFHQTKECRFGTMCALGWKKEAGMCTYANEWATYVDDRSAAALTAACSSR